MKITMRALAAVLALLMLTIGFTACGDDTDNDVVIIEPADSEDAVPKVTMPTKIYESGVMSASLLISIYGSDMSWYIIAGYNHTEDTPGTAVFPIDCGEKEDGTMTVVYDPETGVISKADLVLYDTHIDLLTDDRAVITEIRTALKNE